MSPTLLDAPYVAFLANQDKRTEILALTKTDGKFLEHKPTANHCHAPPVANNRRGIPPRKRDRAKANRSFPNPFFG